MATKRVVAIVLMLLLVGCGSQIEPAAPNITVVVVTATPVPTEASESEPTLAPTLAPTSKPPLKSEPTADFDAYIEEAVGYMLYMQSGMQSAGELFQDPQLYSDSWRLDVATALAFIRAGYEMLEEMDVEPSFSDFHGQVLYATVDCYTATDYVASGIDNVDKDDLDHATELMESCGKKMRDMSERMSETLP